MLCLTRGRAVAIVLAIVASSCTKDEATTDGGPLVDGGARDASGAMDAGAAADAAGGRADGSAPCTVPADCQDGVFCNGFEACAPGTTGADARGCVHGTAPCSGACEETAQRCTPARCEALPPACTSDASCSDGLACDGIETCDATGSCLPGTVVTCAAPMHCLEPGATCGCTSDADCDDGAFCNGRERCAAGACMPGVAPCGARGCVEADDACNCTSGADCADTLYCDGLEYCSATTNRCAVLTVMCPAGAFCLEGRNRCGTCLSALDCDDGIASNGMELCDVATGRCQSGRVDADGDGHASIATGGDDCDDADATRYPGNPEVCDAVGHDEDCDPTTFGSRDADSDGFVDARCCNTDGAGVMHCGDDCDDTRSGTHRTAVDSCNEIDDDCDGAIDEGVSAAQFRDRDSDGAGDPDCTEMRCPGSAGWVLDGNDCDDTRAAIHAGTTSCDPSGAGVRTCNGGAWTSAPCPAGTSCRPQPDGTGLCL